jgi:heat shock protein HspQ
MDITEASKRTNCPDERQDLMDDHLLHREDDEEVAEQNAEDTLTNDIEKDPPVKPKVKRPRTKAQQEAFKKAQLALKAKREKEKERKASAPRPFNSAGIHE